MAKTLTWWAPFCAGGLGDRLLGMVSSYCMAREMGREFRIKWDTQDMSSAFTIDPKYNYYTYNHPVTHVLYDNITSQRFFSDRQNAVSIQIFDHILIWSNQNLYQYLANALGVERERYEKTLYDAFALTFTEFLHPVNTTLLPNLENAIGIHIRTRDVHFTQPERKHEHVPYITDILTRCKAHIENTNRGRLIYVASDCDLTYSLAEQVFGPDYTIIHNDGAIIHSMNDSDPKGLQKVVADLMSMGKCRSLYLGWNTNFPKVGGLLNGRRKFYNYEHPSAPRLVSDFPALEMANYFSWGGREK